MRKYVQLAPAGDGQSGWGDAVVKATEGGKAENKAAPFLALPLLKIEYLISFQAKFRRVAIP